MKITILPILFILLTASVIYSQDTKKLPVETASPADTKPSVNSSPKKRPDLNNLIGLTGQKAPVFVSKDINENEYNIENLTGKIVVINLWATWCQPCIEEFPELNALVNKFKDKDIVFLAVTSEDKALVENFLQKNSFSYQIIPAALNVMKQYSPKEKPDPVTGKSRTIQALPTHIVIDREGNVVKHIWGSSANKIFELSQTIEQQLTSQK